MPKITIKDIPNKFRETNKEEKIILREKPSRLKEIKEEPEEMEEEEEKELTLEEKLQIIQRMRASQHARQLAAMQSQSMNRAPALEQVASQEIPQTKPRAEAPAREEPKVEERKTGYTEIKKEYNASPGRTEGATYQPNKKEEGKTYEGKKDEKEESRPLVLGQQTIRDREADTFRMNRENKDLSDPARTQTYKNDNFEEKKKKKDLW